MFIFSSVSGGLEFGSVNLLQFVEVLNLRFLKT